MSSPQPHESDSEREMCTTHPERTAMSFAASCRECWDAERKADRALQRLEAENERLRALFRKLYEALPPSSAFDNLAREIKREMR